MKCLVAGILCLAVNLSAQDVTFSTVRMMVPAGKKAREKRVDLVFANGRNLVVRLAGADLVTIPFSNIEKIDYEYAKRHRIAEGAMIMALSLGTGAIVMLTKSTSHWMGVEFQEDGHLKQLTLRLDKSDYQSVISAAEAQTGKKVERLGQGGPERAARGSHDVDELVSYPPDRVEAALRSAMEAQTCVVSKAEPGYLECSRPTDGEAYKGEKLVAKFAAEGDRTHVRIETHKGVMGRAMKKNWSTPIFNQMLKVLQGA